MDKDETVLEVRSVSQSFAQAGHGALPVLDHIDLTIRSGEIVGLLGRSGAGKSTLLRIIAGLLAPTSGEVHFHGSAREAGALGIAMVFQTFALFPWLTVQQNVEIGLESQNVAPDEMRRRVLDAIEMAGLRGFESAYPRELSGGMRQRAGFARAFVVRPDLLLMDEPFSALDVLTAATLQTDFVDLWIEGKMPIRAVLLVTHNIDEAVLLCDRVLVLESNPGRVAAEVPVTCAHPRDRLDAEFQGIADRLYAFLTEPSTTPAKGQEVPNAAPAFVREVPKVSVNQIAGLLETLASAAYAGRANLAGLSAALHLQLDEIMPVAEAVHLLAFAQIDGAAIELSPAGRYFVDADTRARQEIFAEHLVRNVPLAARIRRTVRERPDHRVGIGEFVDLLRPYLSEGKATALLRSLIGWGRYGALYAYDARTREFAPPTAAPVRADSVTDEPSLDR
ncbi:MAG: nitrate/sulfonate/bicarbonate ABC transporter ATP-binding protein [Vulcanimicrobiaceae bacterium]